jgi:hypothetical protein
MQQVKTDLKELDRGRRSAIDSHGGPRYNAVCLKCIEQLDLINRLKL